MTMLGKSTTENKICVFNFKRFRFMKYRHNANWNGVSGAWNDECGWCLRSTSFPAIECNSTTPSVSVYVFWVYALPELFYILCLSRSLKRCSRPSIYIFWGHKKKKTSPGNSHCLKTRFFFFFSILSIAVPCQTIDLIFGGRCYLFSLILSRWARSVHYYFSEIDMKLIEINYFNELPIK